MNKPSKESSQPPDGLPPLTEEYQREIDDFSASSEPQAWTPKYVKALIHESPAFKDIYKRLSDAHNTALAAEHSRAKSWEEVALKEEKVARKAEHELAAGREKRKLLVEVLKWAWTIIANAGGGDWERESKEWQQAAAKGRDEAYHPALAQVKEGK